MEALQEAEKKIEILESEVSRKDKEISVLREHLRSHRKSIYTLSEQAEKSDFLEMQKF